MFQRRTQCRRPSRVVPTAARRTRPRARPPSPTSSSRCFSSSSSTSLTFSSNNNSNSPIGSSTCCCKGAASSWHSTKNSDLSNSQMKTHPPCSSPSPSRKEKHKSEDWPESWIRSNFRSTFPRNCDQVKFSNELWWLELKIEDWRVFNWTCDKKWDPASSRATYPPHSPQSMINGNTTSRSNYLDF